MALLLSADALGARRAAVAGPLAPLAASLRADLAPAVARVQGEGVWLPPEKAELSRAGGVCPADGARLTFDPFSQRAHECPRCGRVYTDEAHYRWWIMGYQLWLAERAVHAAALHAVAPDLALGSFAASVLSAHADAYLRYPNADNVLGPARPFFSTYLESLWLLHVCTALDLLETAGAGPAALGASVRERVVEPSRALIASFAEGRSNRQVWNAAARLAASRVLGDAAGAREAVHGPGGVADLLDAALLADGSWFEGENYHQFAHRGFWCALRMAEQAGLEIDAALLGRFRAGYAAPFRVALPDETLPARRDAQYAVSLRQWRWAEWCELGVADGAPGPLGAWLARLYAPADPPLPHRTGRWRATGESERNEPASALSRADLGWKSLLFASPVLPAGTADAAPGSELLPEQGYAVLRRDGGRVYAALDYGGGGGGHGHPDRLNVILQDGPNRWLDDPGTGTYVERALHWYRSTLAHCAPLVDGRSQERTDRGALLGYDPASVPSAEFAGVAARAGVGSLSVIMATRALVASDAYVVDLFTWHAERGCVVDLPFHVDGETDRPRLRWSPFLPGGAGGLEDGFDFLSRAEAAVLGPHPVRLTLHAPGTSSESNAALWLHAPAATLWRAASPGPPGADARRFHAVRMHGQAGAVAAVWDLRGTVARVRGADDGTVQVEFTDGRVDRHAAPRYLDLSRDGRRTGGALPAAGGDWRVRCRAPDGSEREHHVAVVQPRPRPTRNRSAARPYALPAARPDVGALRVLEAGHSHTFELGAPHYVRSEPTWQGAGAPTAVVKVRLSSDARTLVLDVDVHLGRAPSFAPAGAVNPLDNERADVNSDGLQLLISPASSGGPPVLWLLVPELPPPAVRRTLVSGAEGDVGLDARWAPRPNGWRLTCRLPLAALRARGDVVALDLAVNEKPPERARRRGQLRLGEPDSPFVYLRGDRMDAGRAVRFLLPPAVP